MNIKNIILFILYYPALIIDLIKSFLGIKNNKLRVLLFHFIPQEETKRFQENLIWLQKYWKIVDPNTFDKMINGNYSRLFDLQPKEFNIVVLPFGEKLFLKGSITSLGSGIEKSVFSDSMKSCFESNYGVEFIDNYDDADLEMYFEVFSNDIKSSAPIICGLFSSSYRALPSTVLSGAKLIK